MRRALTMVVVCCVLTATTLAVVDGATAQNTTAVTETSNTTGSLTIGSDALETASYQPATLDVSGALTLDARSLDGQFRQGVLDERANQLEDSNARREQLNRSVIHVEAGIDRLRDRQAAAVRGYNNGSLADREFVITLAYIDVAAGRLETAAGRVADRADSLTGATVDGQPVDNWAKNRRMQLGALQGPVRNRIAGALRGENTVRIDDGTVQLDGVNATRTERLEPLRIYVETSDNGVVLSTVDDGTYFREAYLPGERNTTAAEGFSGITDAFEQVRTTYPWAWNHSSSKNSSGDARAGIYTFTLLHSQGVLTSYLNGTAGRVFAERQRIDLSSVPTADPVSARNDDLRLRVNRTYPTGPLELSLSTADGDPVDGRVTIENRSVGATGSDGRLWTVAPSGPLTAVATTSTGTVRVETDATVESNTTEGPNATVRTTTTALVDGTRTAEG